MFVKGIKKATVIFKVVRYWRKARTRNFILQSGRICYNKYTGCQGTVSHTLVRKGVVFMTTYEALTFAVAFATLMVLVVKKK